MSIRVMLINAIDATNDIETAAPGLGLAYLASALRRAFGPDRFDFRIVDRDVEQQIGFFAPHVVGLSAVSQNYGRAMEYARMAKRHDLPVLVGGVHISALPSTLTADMDVGIIGEGEAAAVDLFNLLLDGGRFDEERLARIRGIVFRRGGELVITDPRPLIEPLDSLATPDRDLLTIEKTTYMFTSRGCPYDCTFCASCRFWGKVRFFSAQYVADEIKFLVERYGVERIAFLDDLFVANKARIAKICDRLRSQGILGKVRFTCNARSNLVTDELMLLLKEMNVDAVGMGLESGSPRTLEYLKGRNISLDSHVNAIATLRRHGIEPSVSFIIGSPQETREDIERTLSFIRENDLRHFDLYVLTPFPGTPVWEYASGRGLVSEDMDWTVLNVNFMSNADRAIILSEKLSRAEICELFTMLMMAKKKMRRRARQARPLKWVRSLWARMADR